MAGDLLQLWSYHGFGFSWYRNISNVLQTLFPAVQGFVHSGLPPHLPCFLFFFLIVDEWNPFFLGSREAMYPTVLKTSSLIVVELTAWSFRKIQENHVHDKGIAIACWSESSFRVSSDLIVSNNTGNLHLQIGRLSWESSSKMAAFSLSAFQS